MRGVFVAGSILLSSITGCATGPGLEGPEGRDMAPVISFTDPAKCEPSAAFSILLDGLLEQDENGRIGTGAVIVPAAFRRNFGTIEVEIEGQNRTASVPVDGTLYGLPLKSVHTARYAGGDPYPWGVTFAAPEAQVRPVLEQAGFDFARSTADRSMGVYEMFVTLMPGGAAETTLLCGYS